MRNPHPFRFILHVATALGVVVSLYGAPVALNTATGWSHGGANADVFILETEPEREAVVWIPPADEPSPPTEATSDVPDEPVREEVAEPAATDRVAPDVVPSKTPVLTTRGPSAVAKRVAARKALAKARMERLRARRAKVRAAARKKARPKRQLTAKEQRVVERRKRRRGRRAERKQCADLIEQVVQVDDFEWWVGREVVGCYRLHPEQFAAIGGIRWHEDARGKKRGLKLYVSSRTRGDMGRAAGFQKNDILKSINGVRVKGWFGASAATTQLLRRKAKIKLMRDGEEMELLYRVVGDEDLAEATLIAAERAASQAELDAIAAAEAPVDRP